jgi:prophage tail gpP-like protein
MNGSVPGPNNVYVTPTRPINSQYSREQAVLRVAGIDFQDWETVWVQLRWAEDSSYFRFTAAERDTPPGMFAKLQFVPGDDCVIILGGTEVIHGKIETRQVAFDGTNHSIELQGKSYTAWPARSSVNSKTGNFDNMNFFQVATKVLSQFPIGVKVIGSLNPLPFDKLQNQPGEQVWDFLERIARPRGIVLGSDSFGNFLLIGDHSMPVVNTELIEGQNIKKMQYLIHKSFMYSEYKVIGQAAASDDNSGTQASQLEGSYGGSGYLNSILITPAEQPVKSVAEIMDRAKNEAKWHEGTKLEAHVTVQGWYRSESNLWWPGEDVYINSPMCPLDMTMKIKSATYEQSSSRGTETTLEFAMPWLLNDYNVTPPGKNQPAEPGVDAPAPMAAGQNVEPFA